MQSTARRWLGVGTVAALLGTAALLALIDLDRRAWSLLANTICLGLGVVGLAVPTGTMLAILIGRTDVWCRSLAWSVLLALLFIPLYLQAAGWDAWFGRQGWFWPAQDAAGRRMAAAIWIHAAAAIPWVAIIVGAGLQQIAPELEEAALLDMSAGGVVWHVTLPLSRPAVLIAAWWVFAMAAGDMTVTDLYQVRTFAEEIYTTIPLLEPGDRSAAGGAVLPRGTFLWALATFVALLALMQLARFQFPPASRGRLTIRLGAWNLPLTAVLLGTILIIAIVPLVNLGLDAGTRLDRAGGDVVTRHWSAEQFATVVSQSPWHFRREIGWTAAIACGAACCALAISLPLTWGVRAWSGREWLGLVVTSLAAATPGPVVALAVISCMNREDSRLLVWLYDRTLLPPMLAATARALPVVMLVSWWGARTIPPALFDLARLDGLSLLGQWWHLGRPLRSRVYFIAWCAAVAAAAGDLAATLLVTPPGVNTLAMRIFGLLHAGVDDQVAGISLANVLFCVFLALLVLQVSRSWRNI